MTTRQDVAAACDRMCGEAKATLVGASKMSEEEYEVAVGMVVLTGMSIAAVAIGGSVGASRATPEEVDRITDRYADMFRAMLTEKVANFRKFVADDDAGDGDG